VSQKNVSHQQGKIITKRWLAAAAAFQGERATTARCKRICMYVYIRKIHRTLLRGSSYTQQAYLVFTPTICGWWCRGYFYQRRRKIYKKYFSVQILFFM
jgi:hypothetical protein